MLRNFVYIRFYNIYFATATFTDYLIFVYIQSNVNSASDAKLRYNGKYATGGYISSGNTAVVAEYGPELLEIMNGGVRVTPLTGAVRNTAVGAETAEQRTVLINNTIHVGKISNDYDVKTLAQSLAEEQRRIESGRGQR